VATQQRSRAGRHAGKQQPGGRRNLGVLSLVGLGVGGIIGAGFFLGSGIVIRETGPAIVLTYLVGGVVLAQVMGAITSLAVNVPVKTSYREYIQRFLGSYFGFFLGWAVFVSGVLSIGSEAVAMAVYSRTWVPAVPLGVFAVAYVLLIVFLNTLGMARFGKVETLMSVVKSGVLAGFIVVALLLVIHALPTAHPVGVPVMTSHGGVAPKGPLAIFRGMLIVIFSYAGVTTLAMATARARHPVHDIPAAAVYTTLTVVLLYALSVLGLVLLVPWTMLSPHQSPFVTALAHFHYMLPSAVVNGAILVASFSVMAGTFYATEWMLIALALDKGAPKLFRHSGPGRPWPALLATTGLLLATLVLAFVLPSTVYTDLTASSSYFSFVNWLLILLAFAVWYGRHRKPEHAISGLAFGAPYGAWFMAAAIAGLGIYSATVPSFQLGFYLFVAMSAVISGTWFLFVRRRPHLA
jgi:L-asparagine transporter-like permease